MGQCDFTKTESLPTALRVDHLVDFGEIVYVLLRLGLSPCLFEVFFVISCLMIFHLFQGLRVYAVNVIPHLGAFYTSEIIPGS